MNCDRRGRLDHCVSRWFAALCGSAPSATYSGHVAARANDRKTILTTPPLGWRGHGVESHRPDARIAPNRRPAGPLATGAFSCSHEATIPAYRCRFDDLEITSRLSRCNCGNGKRCAAPRIDAPRIGILLGPGHLISKRTLIAGLPASVIVATALVPAGTLNTPLASSPFSPTGTSATSVLSPPVSSVSLAVAPFVSTFLPWSSMYSAMESGFATSSYWTSLTTATTPPYFGLCSPSACAAALAASVTAASDECEA